MGFMERTISAPGDGIMVAPSDGSDIGVLVLAGSSGRIETDRCRVLAGAGMIAASLRWFGGPGQPPGICEIPLETFIQAIDVLAQAGARRFGVLGVSKGAEAALLLADRDPRIDAVVALSPTSVVWANVGPGRDGLTHPYRSSWTWRGEPLPFVPYDDDWTRPEPAGSPVAFRRHYEQSRQTFAEAARRAAIPIERLSAEVVLVAGGDDQLWPSLTFAQELASRAAAAGRRIQTVTSADAGHRPRLPGEAPASPSERFRYGGTAQADAALGAMAWPRILDALLGRTIVAPNCRPGGA